MEYIFIYLLQIFDYISSLRALSIIGCFIGTIAYGIALCGTKFKGENFTKNDFDFYDTFSVETGINLSKVSKKFLTISVILLFLLSIIPTKQTLILMSGVYYGKMAAKQVITSEKIKKVNEIIDLKLDEVIKELKNGSQGVSQTQR